MRIRALTLEDYAPIIGVVDAWWGGRTMAAMLPRLFFIHFRDTSFVAKGQRRQQSGGVVPSSILCKGPDLCNGGSR